MTSTLSENGGDKRDRTADLLHAMQALSQLSYSPSSVRTGRILMAVWKGVKFIFNIFQNFLPG